MMNPQLKSLYLAELVRSDVHGKPRVRWPAPFENFNSIVRDQVRDLSRVDPSHLYFWSDQHFFHKNVIRYSNRPFQDLVEMNDTMIKNYKNTITDDDIVVWVGDVAFTSDNTINTLLQPLPGYKILVVGNHDFMHGNFRRYTCFDEMHLMLDFGDFIVTHYPWDTIPPNKCVIHGHIHQHKHSDSRNINVSVEQVGYTPKSLINIITQLQSQII